jgi:hypothetical protein
VCSRLTFTSRFCCLKDVVGSNETPIFTGLNQMTDQPSVETKQELVVEPAPHITGPMSKTRLMTFTFGALLAITIITAVLWWPVNEPVPKDVTTLQLTNYWVMPLGAVVLINALTAIGSAVGADTLAHLIHRKNPSNTMSAAVFGLIVTLSYSLGTPTTATGDPTPADFLVAPTAFLNVAIISLLGLQSSRNYKVS